MFAANFDRIILNANVIRLISKGMRLHTSGRSFTWFANACRYANADVFLGLAPGTEVELLKKIGGDLFCQFAERMLPISKHRGAQEMIPLRVCALRDSSLCRIERTGMPGDLEGFERVRLVFNPQGRRTAANGVQNGHAEPAAGPVKATPPVIGFLLTIGLQNDAERHFFNGVVTEFLDHSWASFPKLLREVGCAEPSVSS